LVCRRPHWGEDRVTYLGHDGRLHSISADLTDIDPIDAFRRVAAGKAAFHPVDLLALCELIERLLAPEVVNETLPHCKVDYAAGADRRQARS